MNLDQGIEVLLRTHTAALARGTTRASCYVLESGPGVGKSEGTFRYAQLLAEYLNMPVGVRQFMLTTVTSADVRGFMLPVRPEGAARPNTVFSVPPWYPQAAVGIWVYEPRGDAGEGHWWFPGTWSGEVPEVGVLFLDEWGQAEEDVKKPAAELVLHGCVGDDHLPHGWRVVAAQNRMSDRSGTVREMMFIVNRRGLLKITPSLQPWLKWVDRQDDDARPHYLTVSFAQKNPDIVFGDAVPDKPEPFCTARSLCIMDREVRALASEEGEGDSLSHARRDMPMDDIAREVCAGWIGEGAAAQYFTHLKFADVLPDMEDVEKRPLQAKLPAGRDAQMVCAYMLSHGITDNNASNVLKYILRLNEEMQILAVGVVSAKPERHKLLVMAPEYNVWLLKNKGRLIAAQS